MTDKLIIDGEHDMNYCEDSNCKHYGKKEQCEKTHCYYRCYSKLYKQLKRKEQECEELERQYEILQKDMLNCTACRTTEKLNQQLDQLKAENEILKEKLVISSNADKQTIKMIQVLDEIEEYLKTQLDGFGNAVYSVDKSAITKIADIINKAKDGE